MIIRKMKIIRKEEIVKKLRTLILQIIFICQKIFYVLISCGWDDKFYGTCMYNLVQTHIIYIYSNIARATKVALANFRIYKSEECLPK